MAEIIKDIFQTLNEDNVVPQYLLVLQKKMTESKVKIIF
jgi:hypothetical protein